MPTLCEMGPFHLSPAATKSAWNPFPKKAAAHNPPERDAWTARRTDVPLSDDIVVNIPLSDGVAQSQLGCTRSACISGSGFFARMFDGAWKESLQQAACQKVPNLKIGEAVLNYLQGDPLPLDDNNVVDTAVMADYWDIPHLRSACETYIDQNLTNDNLSDLFAASCNIGDATASFTTHIWQVAGMLSLASPLAPQGEASQWLDEHPNLLPSAAKTVARSKPVPGAPGSYHLQVRWFEPDVLPNIKQGKSTTFATDGLQWHVKRIIKREEGVASYAGFDLRVRIPSSYPSQGSCFTNGKLLAVNQFSLNYTLSPDLERPKRAQAQAPNCGSDSEASNAKQESCYMAQTQCQAQTTKYYSSSSDDEPAEPAEPDPSTVSDDENDLYAFSNTAYQERIANHSTREVGLAHEANTAADVNMRVWQISLDSLDLSHDAGIFRADGSQFFQLDGIFKAVPLGGPGAQTYTRYAQACILDKDAEQEA